MLQAVFGEWQEVIARLCIGLRRIGTGGAFVLTPSPKVEMLHIGYPFVYRRLGDAAALFVLDKAYSQEMFWKTVGQQPTSDMGELVSEGRFAETDAEDREDEVTGGVRLVTSLAAVDGLVLMTPTLHVLGFGVKIKPGSAVGKVFDGPEFSRKGRLAKRIDVSRFGTRHGTMLSYCGADRNAVGIIVSQDGEVRVIVSRGRNLTLWDNVKLLGLEENVRAFGREIKRQRRFRRKHRNEQSFGYSSMPKTIEALMAWGIGGKRRETEAKPVSGSPGRSRQSGQVGPAHRARKRA